MQRKRPTGTAAVLQFPPDSVTLPPLPVPRQPDAPRRGLCVWAVLQGRMLPPLRGVPHWPRGQFPPPRPGAGGALSRTEHTLVPGSGLKGRQRAGPRTSIRETASHQFSETPRREHYCPFHTEDTALPEVTPRGSLRQVGAEAAAGFPADAPAAAPAPDQPSRPHRSQGQAFCPGRPSFPRAQLVLWQL